MGAFNVRAAIEAAKSKGPDMTQASSGGGDFELPVEGFTRLRFVGYIEKGQKESEYKGQKKINNVVDMIFELSGPKHSPREVDGVKYPYRVTKKNMNLSLNEKSGFFKLFTAMNYDKKATHIAELLGNAFVAEVKHNKTKYDGKDFTHVNLENIRKPYATNPETGDEYEVNVDPPLTELKLFLWDFATPEMWDALFIAGEYEEQKDKDGKVTREARSKNVIQESIMAALNWKGNAVYDYAMKKITKADSEALDDAVGGVEEARAPEGADSLAGIA